MFVPCTDGLVALSVSATSIRVAWKASHPVPGLSDPGCRRPVGNQARFGEAVRAKSVHWGRALQHIAGVVAAFQHAGGHRKALWSPRPANM